MINKTSRQPGIPKHELMHLAVRFNVSFQKVKSAVYTLGHDIKSIEAFLQTRKQKMEPAYN